MLVEEGLRQVDLVNSNYSDKTCILIFCVGFFSVKSQCFQLYAICMPHFRSLLVSVLGPFCRALLIQKPGLFLTEAQKLFRV